MEKGGAGMAGGGVRGAMSGNAGGKSDRGCQIALLKAAALGWLNLARPPPPKNPPHNQPYNPPQNPPKEAAINPANERKQNDHPKKSSESNESSEPKKESAAGLDDQRLIFASLVM